MTARLRRVEDDLDPVLVRAARREALAVDRPRRDDVPRPQRRVERRQLVGQVAGADVGLRDPLAVHREDLERPGPAVADVQRPDPEVVVLRELVEHAHEPHVGAASHERRMRLGRELEVGVVQQRLHRLLVGQMRRRPRRRPPPPPAEESTSSCTPGAPTAWR